MQGNSSVGAWQVVEKGTLPQKVATAFSKSVKNLKGAKYKPVLYCGFQVVSGTNHMIICRQTLVTSPLENHWVKFVVHIPLEGDPRILFIDRII
jgi:hypothetical protein